MKQDLRKEVREDLDKVRGALLEIIENNRKINRNIMDELESSDYSLLEELGLLQKGILDSAKILSDIHSAQPKTIKEIDSIEQEKSKINLEDLIEDD